MDFYPRQRDELVPAWGRWRFDRDQQELFYLQAFVATDEEDDAHDVEPLDEDHISGDQFGEPWERDGRPIYWLSVPDDFATPSLMIHWFYQLGAKSWMSAEDMGAFVAALDELFSWYEIAADLNRPTSLHSRFKLSRAELSAALELEASSSP